MAKMFSADNLHDAMPFLQRALPLAKLGLRVYPIVPRHKHPLLPDYKRLATIDQAVLITWAAECSTANVGILIGERLMGEQATHYAVLDIDHRHHGDRSLTLLEQMHPALPMTWQVQSGDGQHIYLALPTHIQPLCQSKDLAPGITLLTAGHPLVGPGSIHPSGHVYDWMPCYDPASVKLAMMPHWLIDLGITKGVLCERRLPKSPLALSSQTPVLQRKRCPIAGEQKITKKCSFNRVVLLADCRDELDAVTGDEADIPRQLTGETVKDLLSQKWVAQRCMSLLKIPHYALSGRKFCCVLHQERHPSASLVAPRNSSEQWLYVDHHCKDDGPRTLPLPLVYFCQMTGQPTPTRLNTPELLTWSVRLLRDAGVLDGAVVRAPKLPADAPDHARSVYEGFQDLLSVKWRVTPGAASPFVWRFAERWIGLQAWHVSKGMKWLLSRGYIRFVQLEFGCSTFLPGTRHLIHRRKKRTHADTQKQAMIIQDAQTDVDAFLQDGETPRHQPHTEAAAGQCLHGSPDFCVACERERIQARLLTKRREHNMVVDAPDPFGRQAVGGSAR